jgi:heme O synthase-like polyprenyltransferase
MKTINLEKIIFYINIIALVYFAALAILSYYPIEITFFNVIAQIISLPLLMFLIFSLGYSSFEIIKKEKKKNTISIFILSLTSISSLIVLTIIQLK